MARTPADWYNSDPTGRYEHRHADGQRWINHVGAHGQQSVDEMPSRPPDPSHQESTPATPNLTRWISLRLARHPRHRSPEGGDERLDRLSGMLH